MPTPANERFKKLFANKPQPKTPVKEPVSVSEHEVQNLTLQNSVTGQSWNDDAKNLTQERSIFVSAITTSTASDSEDEYTSLFSKKKNRNAGPVRHRSKPVNGTSPSTDDKGDKLFEKIEYLPQGKSPLTKSCMPDNGEDWNDRSAVEHRGNGHSLVGRYCVFSLAAKFPYKYMRDSNDRVSRRFFAQNKFYDRSWNLYYLHLPETLNKAALVLIPISQMQQLVNEIASTFNVKVEVPPSPFTLDFYDDGTPQPCFLGSSSSREEANDLIEKIPEAEANHGECPPGASGDVKKAYEAFHDKVEDAVCTAKGKTKSKTQKKANKLFHILEESREQIVRAERYLGLKPQAKPTNISDDLSCGDTSTNRNEQLKSCGLFVEFLDLKSSAKYPFEHEPVFISIDIESYERNHGLITEIGISTLDTLDLADIAPGDTEDNWIKHIRSRHFRIRGREHLVNSEFCVGNPDAFQFGSSEFVSLDMVVDTVDDCFEWPFSVQYKKEGPSPPQIDTNSNPNSPKYIDPSHVQKGPKQRNIVLVGHDINSDIAYLRKLGSSMFNPIPRDPFSNNIDTSRRPRKNILPSILETLDTATMYQSIKMEPQTRSLSHICANLGIDAWYPHNAGNDARYTLEALIKLVINARLDEDKGQRLREPASHGITIDDYTAAKQARIDEKMTRIRAEIKERVAMLFAAPDSNSTETTYDDYAPIDWTLPFRPSDFKRPASKPQTAESAINTVMNTWQNDDKENTASTNTAWRTEAITAPGSQPTRTPKAGW